MAITWRVKESDFLPKWLTKSQTNKFVQLFSGQSHLGFFKYRIGRCFSPVCTCMVEEETADHFLERCPFYDNLRKMLNPKSLAELSRCSSTDNWVNTVKFVDAS